MKKALTGSARVALAQAYFEVFRLKDAERLIADDSLDGDAHANRLRAELAVEASRPDEAIAFAKRALELNEGEGRAREILAMLNALPDPDHPTRGQPMRSLRPMLIRAGATAVVLTLIVVAYASRVRTGEAVGQLVKSARADRDKMDKAALERAAKSAHDAVELQATPAALAVWAESETLLAFEYGGDKPVESLQRVIAKNVQSGERYFAEATSLVMAGAAAKAESLTTQVVKDGGVDARVLLALGLANKALGRLGAAKDALKRGFELNPYHPVLAVELGDAYLLEGDLRNADYHWRKAAEANPLFPRAQARLKGEGAPGDPVTQWFAAHAQPSPDKFEALAARFPGVESIVFDWARAAGKGGKVSDAEAVLQRTPDVGNTPRAQALLAEIALPTDAKKAETLAKTVLTTDPKQADALYVMGRVCQQRGDAQKALQSYSQALEARASFPEVYEQVGNIFVEQKELDKGKEQLLVAERQYRQAGIAPARIYENLARCADLQGNAKEAAEWRKAVKR